MTITFLKRLEYGILSPPITLRWLASWIIWRPKGTGIFHLCLIPEGFVASFLIVLYTYQLRSFVKALMYYLLPKSLLDQMFSDKEIAHNQDRKNVKSPRKCRQREEFIWRKTWSSCQDVFPWLPHEHLKLFLVVFIDCAAMLARILPDLSHDFGKRGKTLGP